MLNIIELQKNLIGVDHGPAAVLPTIVGQYMFHFKAMSFVERQYPIIEGIDSGLRELRSVELAKGKGTVGVHHRLQIDPADAFEGAHHEGILTQEIARVRALYLSFTEAGIGFLQKLYLFLGQFYLLAVLFLLKAQEAFITGFHVFLDPDIANRARAHTDTMQTKLVRDPHRSPGRMIKGKCNDLFLDFRGSLIGEALGNGELVQEPIQTPLLEGPFVLVELAPGNAVPAAGLGDVTQSFSKL